MTFSKQTIFVPALAAALAAAFAAPAAAGDGWQFQLSGVYAESTAAGGTDGSFGAGLAAEYRLTPRLGIELGALTAELEDETRVDFLGVFEATARTSLGYTPILARLDFHLTPGRRADIRVGPVAGYVFFDDLTVRTTLEILGVPVPVTEEIRLRTDDQFTWGAHAGVDVRIGGADSRAFVSAGLTYLDLPVEVEVPAGGDGEIDGGIDFDTQRGDLDPLILHLGFGLRF